MRENYSPKLAAKDGEQMRENHSPKLPAKDGSGFSQVLEGGNTWSRTVLC